MLYAAEVIARGSRRSPHGERGLKLGLFQGVKFRLGSLPTRGAWVEIFFALGST